MVSWVTAYLFPHLFKLSVTFPTLFKLLVTFSALDASQSIPVSEACFSLLVVSQVTTYLFPCLFKLLIIFPLSTPLNLLQRLAARLPTARGFSGHRLFISAFFKLSVTFSALDTSHSTPAS